MQFWNDTHPLSGDYDRLFNQLVPASGCADTLAGEVLRAASRINYDHYNNGSCNNSTGAWNFLDSVMTPLMLMSGQKDRVADMNRALLTVKPYMNSNGPQPSFDEQDVNESMDIIAEVATRFALSQESNGEFAPNTVDMWDYNEDDQYYYEEEDEWY